MLVYSSIVFTHVSIIHTVFHTLIKQLNLFNRFVYIKYTFFSKIFRPFLVQYTFSKRVIQYLV